MLSHNSDINKSFRITLIKINIVKVNIIKIYTRNVHIVTKESNNIRVYKITDYILLLENNNLVISKLIPQKIHFQNYTPQNLPLDRLAINFPNTSSSSFKKYIYLIFHHNFLHMCSFLEALYVIA